MAQSVQFVWRFLLCKLTAIVAKLKSMNAWELYWRRTKCPFNSPDTIKPVSRARFESRKKKTFETICAGRDACAEQCKHMHEIQIFKSLNRRLDIFKLSLPHNISWSPWIVFTCTRTRRRSICRNSKCPWRSFCGQLLIGIQFKGLELFCLLAIRPSGARAGKRPCLKAANCSSRLAQLLRFDVGIFHRWTTRVLLDIIRSLRRPDGSTRCNNHEPDLLLIKRERLNKLIAILTRLNGERNSNCVWCAQSMRWTICFIWNRAQWPLLVLAYEWRRCG